MKKINTAKRRIDRVLAFFLVMLMAAAVVNVLWQVFSRFVIGIPSGFTEELARFLLIWVGILGAGYAAGQRAHLALEIIPEQLPALPRARLDIVIEGVVLLFASVVMVLGGSRLVYILVISGQTSPSLNLLMGYVYAVVPISGLLICFYSVAHISNKMAFIRDPQTGEIEPDEINEDDRKDLYID